MRAFLLTTELSESRNRLSLGVVLAETFDKAVKQLDGKFVGVAQSYYNKVEIPETTKVRLGVNNFKFKTFVLEEVSIF